MWNILPQKFIATKAFYHFVTDLNHVSLKLVDILNTVYILSELQAADIHN